LKLFKSAFPSQEALKTTALALHAVRDDTARAPLTLSDEMTTEGRAKMLLHAVSRTVNRYS
jgi:hypothetical protein